VAKKSKRLFCSPYLKNVLSKELFCLIVVKVVLGSAGWAISSWQLAISNLIQPAISNWHLAIGNLIQLAIGNW